jgi:glycosyltransferase involved in cell wall biosynthesis
VSAPLVAIDARIVSGLAGGVETVLIGLAAGLSRLTDGQERYAFLTFEGESAWLAPYISGPCQVEETPVSAARRFARRVPAARRLYGKVRHLRASGAAPLPTDETAERLGASVVHQVLQRGFHTSLPAIYNPHDLQHVHLPEFFSNAERQTREEQYRQLCEQADLVAVTSSWGARDLESHYELPADKVRVIPWAPILGEYRERDAATLDSVRRSFEVPERFAFYPAQTWPHKNHLLLLEAIARLRDARHEIVPLVTSGHQNDYAAVLKRRAHELGLNDQVRWLGFVTPDQLRALYAMARAVVIPTRFEAASGPLWEAFQAGTPAACSTVTSLPDQAGDAALLFDPDDVDGMADALGRLWTDEPLRQTLVERGRRNIARFSWERTARTYRAWYRRLCGVTLGATDQALLDAPPLL